MLEAEWCFMDDVGAVCEFTEAMLRHVLQEVLTPNVNEPVLFQSDLGAARKKALQEVAEGKPWARITYGEAVRLLAAQHATKPFEYIPTWGSPLQSEHERWLAEEHTKGPLFVTDYPASLKPFYMRANTSTSPEHATVACFDLLVPGVGELAGGSLREERLEHLERAIETHGMDAEAYEWYVDSRRFGSAPHGGFGLGLERLVGWLAGVENVRECIPMPRWAGRMSL